MTDGILIGKVDIKLAKIAKPIQKESQKINIVDEAEQVKETKLTKERDSLSLKGSVSQQRPLVHLKLFKQEEIEEKEE